MISVNTELSDNDSSDNEKRQIKYNNKSIKSSNTVISDTHETVKLKMNLESLKQIIPSNALTHSNDELRKYMTEWCCKKYKIGNKKYVLLSFQQPNEKIKFICSLGKIVDDFDMNSFNKYVIQETYWYCLPDNDS